jgi:hypothetical protein
MNWCLILGGLGLFTLVDDLALPRMNLKVETGSSQRFRFRPLLNSWWTLWVPLLRRTALQYLQLRSEAFEFEFEFVRDAKKKRTINQIAES